MRQIFKTVPALSCGGGLSLLCLLPLVVGCTSATVEAVDELPVAPPAEVIHHDVAAVPISEDLVFLADSLAGEEENQSGKEIVPDSERSQGLEAANSIVFSGDPFADPGARVLAAEDSHGHVITQEQLWSGSKPESQLLELEAAPEIGYDDAVLEQAAELGIAQLRARYLTDVLENDALVMVPEGIRTFGEVLPVRFRLRNPLGDSVELIPSPSGYILELDWTVERWLAIGSHDRVQRHRFFRIGQEISLRPDQEFMEYTELPLKVPGNQGSVWLVEVDARLRFNGAAFEDCLLPLHEINFQAARFLVLPPGWESLQDTPMVNLKRVLLMSSEEVDRHVLVCVALLKGRDRQDAVQLLLDSLRLAPTPGRVLTITQALQWLTGEHIGSLPGDWRRWDDRRKMAANR